MNTLLLFLFASLCGLSFALRLPVVSRPSKRDCDQASGGVTATGIPNESIFDFGDQVYATNVTIGGREFLIQLDTGSSDLWLMNNGTPITLTNTTNLTLDDAFGIGNINGTVEFAQVSLGPYTVPNQAFLNVSSASDFDLIFGDGIVGILGLSFDYDSNVDIECDIRWGFNQSLCGSFLTNLFAQNETLSNFITVQLSRADDPQASADGVFTISEHDPQFANITNQPQLPRFPNYNNLSDAPRWSAVVDGMSINGEPFAFDTSSVPGVPSGSVVSMFDTGYTYPPIHEDAVNAIYSSIEGAYFDQSSGLWITPCNQSTTLEFQMGGQSYPVHPLDITIPQSINGSTVCVNTFRPTTFPANNQFDMILGVAFLKNVYASFNYGDWDPANNTGIPFIQLLSTTNLTEAWAEFNTTRSLQVAAVGNPTSSTSSMPSPSPSANASASASPFVQRSFARRSFHNAERRVSEAQTYGKSIPDCLTPLLETYGAFMAAVVTGAVMVFVMGCAVGLALLVRSISRAQAQARAEYMVVDAKAEEDADPESLFREATLRSYHDL